MPLCQVFTCFRIDSKFRCIWSRPLLYLHDVALNGRDALLPLLLVRKVEAGAQRLVVKLLLTAACGRGRSLTEASRLESGGPAGAAVGQNGCENLVSKNSPNFAVALN